MAIVGSAAALLLSKQLAADTLATNTVPAVVASLQCPLAAPGRVSCVLEVQGIAGLVWLDVLVVATPDFAQALRTRVVAEELGAATASGRVVLPLPLVASRSGEGEVSVRVRAVACGSGANAACRPRSQTLTARLLVQ